MTTTSKTQFVSILEEAGITASQREKLHAAFERRHPEGHESFLRWLGISDDEVQQIRQHAKDWLAGSQG